ncbi:MAG: arginine N-succinyltransferase [Phycisphaerae bacterium]|nr:arginine N-succinyltransferase [Phycisphaerae bacterium]
MFVIRPVTMNDLERLEQLAALAGVGLTTLPRDRALLKKRIQKSIRSISEFADRPGGESYLFVMENTETKQVVGASGIVSKVGGFEPFYAYQIEKTVFESAAINIRKEVPILRLVEEHDGPCEVGSLFLDPAFRGDGNGRLLQLVRFLFIAEHPEAFEHTVVSEIRGIIDDNGHSPFWEALGHHFFGIDFPQADYLSVVSKKFIADLMPDHPIYIQLLPKSAQDVIGKAHKDSVMAVRNLEDEGFVFADRVDIFDAGPVITCERDQIRTVKMSRRGNVARITDAPVQSPVYMISTAGAAADFRACKSAIEVNASDGSVRLPDATAAVLDLRIGDAVRYVPLHAKERP